MLINYSTLTYYIYAFLAYTRVTDATFKGPPNLSKNPQRLSHSSFKPNLLLVLA